MRFPILAIGGVAALGLVASLAHAQPGPRREGRGPAAMFDQMDANKDGRVVWEEVWAQVQRRFAEADRDGSGSLTEQEMQDAMQAAWAARRREAGGAGPGPGAGPGSGPGPGPGRGGPPETGQWGGAMFRAIDANRDRQVTLEEIRPAIEARFRAMDANLDNAVERSEVPDGPHRRPGRPRQDGAPAAPANPG